MLKIVFAVALGIILGYILLKTWRYILAAIIIVLGNLLGIALAILTLPFTIIEHLSFSEEKYQKKITTLYDEIFFLDSSEKKVKQHLKTIEKLNNKIKKKKQEKEYKEMLKFLEEVKWVL